MQHQFSIFILSFGTLQGVLLCVLLIRSKAYRGNSWFLLLYLLTLLLQISMKVASKTWLTNHFLYGYHLSYKLPFLYGPLLCLFLTRTLSTKTRNLAELWHFAPFVFFLSIDLLSLSSPELRWLFIPSKITVNLQLLSLGIYHWVALSIIQKQRHTLAATTLKWLKELSIASCILSITLTLALFIMVTMHPLLAELRYLFAIATLFIYWVSYKVMRYPEVIVPSASAQVTEGQQVFKKYHHSTLTEADMDLIQQRLDSTLQQQRPYLDTKLSIDDLATLIGSNRHHLSQVLNERMQKNYYEYLNAYRVEFAQSLLLNPARAHLKIAAIAYESGFNSLSTFNEVFKKMVGCTPSEFKRIEQHKKEIYQLD